MKKDKIYSLCEAVADIAFIAGEQKYYSGNSRADIADFIGWAKEFEKINKSEKWGEGERDYLEEIIRFTMAKIGVPSVPSKEIEQSNPDYDFWLRMFSPRTSEWQKNKLSELEAETGDPFIGTVSERENKIRALKLLLK